MKDKWRKDYSLFLLMIIVIIPFLGSSCSTLTPSEQGAVAGAGIGALAGQAIGRNTTSTLLGAGAGAVAGALAGKAYEQNQQLQRAEQEALALRQQSTQQVRATERPGAVILGGTELDPTKGEFVNSTRWLVYIYIDQGSDIQGKSPNLTISPNETMPANLDIGQHKIIANAYVNTQFGQRLVGKYDYMLTVSARGTGWNVRFTDGSFR